MARNAAALAAALLLRRHGGGDGFCCCAGPACGGGAAAAAASSSLSSSSSGRALRRRGRHAFAGAVEGGGGGGGYNRSRSRPAPASRGARKFSSSPSPSPSMAAAATQSSSGGASSSSSDSSRKEPTLPPILQGSNPLHPSDLFHGTIPPPKSLSPSSAAEFKACPQSYLFQYLYGIRQPSNLVLAKGSLCHTALERVFDLEPADRTLEHLQNLLRVAWSEERMSESYRHLFDVPIEGGGEIGIASEEGGGDSGGGEVRRDVEAEIEWGRSALDLLGNYVELEDPRLVPVPNPLAREIWVSSNLPVVNCRREGSDNNGSSGNNNEGNDVSEPRREGETFLVRGIVDRIDLLNGPYLRIVDYKTGKAPNFKYSPPTNVRIADESFWQLKIYALLLGKMMEAAEEAADAATSGGGGGRKRGGENKGGLPANLRQGIDVRYLRLMYLTSHEGVGRFLDMDLGETATERSAALREVHEDLSGIWTSIRLLVATQDVRAFVHCDRSFCWCHRVRPHFVPGTVWERGNDDGRGAPPVAGVRSDGDL